MVISSKNKELTLKKPAHLKITQFQIPSLFKQKSPL